jgi:DnaK suppressor protein
MHLRERKVFETALHTKQAELLQSMHKREGLAVEAEPDVLDEIQNALDRALVVETLDRSSLLLRAIESALRRLSDGSYGECLRCGGSIRPKRLIAVPWAQFCLKCQEEADREQRNQPDHGDLVGAA